MGGKNFWREVWNNCIDNLNQYAAAYVVIVFLLLVLIGGGNG